MEWCEACRQECPRGCVGPSNMQTAEVVAASQLRLDLSQRLTNALASNALSSSAPASDSQEVQTLFRELYDFMRTEGDVVVSFEAFKAHILGSFEEFRQNFPVFARQMNPTGIAYVDQKEEHTPTIEEWKDLRTKKVFKTFVRKLGGIEKPRIVKCGDKMLHSNMADAKEYVRAHPGCTLKAGWLVFIGAPTQFNFNPHWWVEDESGNAILVSKEVGETHLFVAEPKEPCTKLLFSDMANREYVCKAVCRNPVNPSGQQTEDNFVETAGSERHVMRVPISRRFEHLYERDCEEKEE